MALRQIMDCRLCGAVKRLYFEAKALEILSLSLDRMMVAEARPHAATARDLAKIHEAGEILEANLRAPLTLKALAGMVGVSPMKLKRLFPAVFGMPVHTYIIERRLEEVSKLLREGTCSIKEASYLVGYRNQSHFGWAFKRRFGVSATEYKRGLHD